MSAWARPQSSAQAPRKVPGSDASMVLWFTRPGITSFFPLSSGTQKEWMTLVERWDRYTFVPTGMCSSVLVTTFLSFIGCFGTWNCHHHCSPSTETWSTFGPLGSLARSKIVAMVGTATTARIRAGTIVQPISSGVLPWICFGLSGLPSRYRNFSAKNTVAKSTPTPMTIARIRIGMKRLSIFSAAGPLGSSEFCPLSFPHAARTATRPARRTLHRSVRPNFGTLMHSSLWTEAGNSRCPRNDLEHAGGDSIPGAFASGNSGESEAEAVQGVGAALPVGVDLHLRLQVDPGTEQRLELLAGLRPRVPDHRAALADHDPLLRVALDPHDHPVAEDLVAPLLFPLTRLRRRALGTRLGRPTAPSAAGGVLAFGGLDVVVFEGLGGDHDRMGELVAGDREQLLPHQLGHERGLGLVAHDAVGVVDGPFGQPGLELRHQRVHAVAGAGRERDVGVELPELSGRPGQVIDDVLPPRRVHLVHHEDPGGRDVVHQAGDEPVAGADGRVRLDEEAD